MSTIARIEDAPVAGHDSMEVPGGEAIRSTIEDAAELRVGQSVRRYLFQRSSATGPASRHSSGRLDRASLARASLDRAVARCEDIALAP